jgi:5-methylthioribose kinase
MAEANGEFKGQMKLWVEIFEKKIEAGEKKDDERHAELLELIKENKEVVKTQFKEHQKYHDDNEHKWGMWTLFKKKPAVTLVVGGLFTSGLAYAGFNLKDIIKMLISFAK